MSESMQNLWRYSSLSSGNIEFVESMYETFLLNPEEVSADWRHYFENFPPVLNKDNQAEADIPHGPIIEHFELLGRSKKRPEAANTKEGAVATEYERKQVRVVQMIQAYRQRGHQKARLDPLNVKKRDEVPDLQLHFHQLTPADFDTIFQTGSLQLGKPEATLKEIVETLEATYCNTVGAEFMHIVATEERIWIQKRMESTRSAPNYSLEVKRSLLERLTAAEGMEMSLAAKYPGVKRFGLEGGESLIPMMSELVQRAGGFGVKEMVIGMAHRGRLNVLVNIFGKTPSDLFDEFEGRAVYHTSGDVKYHQGFSSNITTPGGEIHLALAFNPSHLEVVSPVVEGSVRARQDRRQDQSQVVPIILHGDAAFAGQGVVMETFQMSQTRGYTTGGTIHIVINNQIGFTTSKQEDARSTEYCTDVAKMVQAPIFHVNGDDPEAVLFVTQMALDFQQKFKKDVVIDLVCYRRRGHNEADEPAATQPMMYKKIKLHPTTRQIYAQRLIKESAIQEGDDALFMDAYRNTLERGEHVVKSLVTKADESLFVDWRPYLGHEWTLACNTKISQEKLQLLGQQLAAVPENFVVQRQVKKVLDDRVAMALGEMPIDWGFAENLAYATLLDKNYSVRLTGQDVGRGTFSHRHAVLHDQKTGDTHVPLQNLSETQPAFSIYDSLLSEMAVLGFEYGYSTTHPNGLVIWEAQFGDFANNAQVVIDQFISSGEIKWERLCGLVMLLPHGYEGQGPEHSSARLERYLQLCAENNMQICVPTTPAQMFHMLRRQAIRPLRKPLIVLSPKSLLRHKEVVSSIEDFTDGAFQNVIPETDKHNKSKVRRLILCSGKVYYDLRTARREREMSEVAIVRVEQLYPFPEKDLASIIQQYKNVEDVVWCQEEPMNQGAWYSSQHHIRRVLYSYGPDLHLHFAGREASAAPAAGYTSLHNKQQSQLIDDALDISKIGRYQQY